MDETAELCGGICTHGVSTRLTNNQCIPKNVYKQERAASCKIGV